MLTLLSCIAYDHDPLFFSFAVATLLIGSLVTMRLFAQVRESRGDIKRLWLIHAGIIGGGTIWSTHFVAMLAYKSDLLLGYDPFLTSVSLLIVVASTMLGFYTASLPDRRYAVEAGGLIIGLGISLMHYTGMAAVIVSGTYEWNMTAVVLSVVFGAVFCAVATNRIVDNERQITPYDGSIAFVVAVALMHFTSMSGLTIVPMTLDYEVTKSISDGVLGAGIIIVMSLLFLMTLITNLIDIKNAEATTLHYRHLALNDALTGIPNRLGCEQYLSDVLNSDLEYAESVAILAIDLDRFKDTNDVHGHAAGDNLLRVISRRVTECLKEDEMIGRFGGDEFFAVKSKIFMKSDAVEFSERILKAIREPVLWEGNDLATSASIGFSLYPRDGKDSVELMEKADRAMYRAKTSGKNCVVAYDLDMDIVNQERVALSVDLAKSIEKNQLEVHYQLQNDTRTREITGVEALLRWNHAEHGMIPPNTFIPLAEETGLINKLGEWVLNQACTYAAAWEKPIKIAVNVASKQISDPNFPRQVHEALLRTGLSPSRLEIEITESGIIADMDQAVHAIRQLKELGVQVAMDDYGTGYSSLATLQKLPIDKIKIDREFIKEIDVSRHSAAIVSSTLILGESLDIPVLAEGVETEQHLALLNKKGCQQVQGFLFGKPMPNRDLLTVLEEVQAGMKEDSEDAGNHDEIEVAKLQANG